MAKQSSTTQKPNKTPKRKHSTPSVRNWVDEGNKLVEKYKFIVISFLFVLSLALSLVYYLQARNSPIMGF